MRQLFMIKGNFDIPLDFLKTATPALIGVDISSSSIKIVELEQLPKNAGYLVERYVIEPLPTTRSAMEISTIWTQFRIACSVLGNDVLTH
jgi:hypothetical protein